jgi:hypothetical protein
VLVRSYCSGEGRTTYCALRETTEVRDRLGFCEREGCEEEGEELPLHFDQMSVLIL